MAAWNLGFEPSVLAEQIEQTKSVDSIGKASFSGFAHTEHTSILGSMLCLNGEIPESEAQKILNLACFAAAGAGKVTPDALRCHAEALEKAYLRAPKARFRLISSISAEFAIEPVTLRIGTTELCFGRRPTRVAEKTHREIVRDSEHSIFGELPKFYSPVMALVSARNPDEAGTQALNQIDLIRAIWNLWKNRGQRIRISSGKRSPVNALILGPIHTLHTLDGKPATDAWWFEPTYLAPISLWRETHGRAQMLEFTKKVMVLLRKLPYRLAIEAALVRYVRALDSRDWNSTVLQLWSILEVLTGATLNDSHKVTVRRSAFLFKDFEYAIQVLNHLRCYRNAAVHGGKEGLNVEAIMYQAKNFVEALLQFHLVRAGQFESLVEVGAFLDLPPRIVEIDRQLARLKAVRRYVVR